MSRAKSKQEEPAIVDEITKDEPYTGKAYLIHKDSYILSRAFELEFVDGIVVKKTVLGSPDMPSTTIGSITSAIWKQLRSQ